MYKSKSGFTIVELLIVIVVIAILAAITVVAYNGIQKRAYDTKVAAAVDSAVKLLEMHYIDRGSYPQTAAPVCFTVAGSLPAVGEFATNQCYVGFGNTYNIDPSFNAAFSPYTSKFPSTLFPVVRNSNEAFRSLAYTSSPGGAMLMYGMQNSNAACPRGTAVDGEGIRQCLVVLNS